MSFPRVIASLTARIEAVTPSWDPDHTFHAHEGADGVAIDIEAIPDDVVRAFDIRLAGGPEDDGASGFGIDRWRVDLELRIRYPVADRRRSEMMIGSDVPRLVHALIHPTWPSSWDASIRTVTPPGAPRLFELLGPEGEPLALMVTMPFTAIFTDAGEAADA